MVATYLFLLERNVKAELTSVSLSIQKGAFLNITLEASMVERSQHLARVLGTAFHYNLTTFRDMVLIVHGFPNDIAALRVSYLLVLSQFIV